MSPTYSNGGALVTDLSPPSIAPVRWLLGALLLLALYVAYWGLLSNPTTHPLWLFVIVPVAALAGTVHGQYLSSPGRQISRPSTAGTAGVVVLAGAGLVLAQTVSSAAMEWLGLGGVLLLVARAASDARRAQRAPR
jgi:hypothetical protein